MNPQPPEYIGQLCAIGFILMVCFFTFKAIIQNKAIKLQDNFTIGYIEDSNPTVYCSVGIVEPKVKQQKKKKTTTTTSTSTTPNPPPPPEDPKPKTPKPFNPPKQLKPEKKKIDFEDDQLFIDCIDALHSLGLKKIESKKKTREIFLASSPTSIQEFLLLAFRK